MALLLRSDPKIWMGRDDSPRNSTSAIPSEYTSSPVAQPGGGRLGLVLRDDGKDVGLEIFEDLRVPEERRDVNEGVFVEGPDFILRLLEELQVGAARRSVTCIRRNRPSRRSGPAR